MSEFSNDGKVAFWANASENERAPKYKGHAYAHRDIKKGEKVSMALWENEPGDRRPVFRGKMEDARPAQQQSAPVSAPAISDSDPFHDDEIPFG